MQAALPAWGMRRGKKKISRSEGTRRREQHKWFSPHWGWGEPSYQQEVGSGPGKGNSPALGGGCHGSQGLLPAWVLQGKEGLPTQGRHLKFGVAREKTPGKDHTWIRLLWALLPRVILRPRARILPSPFSENRYPRYLIKFLILQVPQMICDLSLARIPFTPDVLS